MHALVKFIYPKYYYYTIDFNLFFLHFPIHIRIRHLQVSGSPFTDTQYKDSSHRLVTQTQIKSPHKVPRLMQVIYTPEWKVNWSHRPRQDKFGTLTNDIRHTDP